MKLYDYIPEALLMQRIEEGYVNVNQHKKFPLAILHLLAEKFDDVRSIITQEE